MVASKSPRTTIALALSSEPCASTTAKTRPSSIREKYSAGPNHRATLVNGTARAAITRVATVPAANDAIAAVPSAMPARPCRAI
jgi:hypothetical protein